MNQSVGTIQQMKLTFTLIVTLFCLTCAAQKWCRPGAVWQYHYWSGLLSVDGDLELYYSGDTVVNGKTCKRISGIFMGKDFPRYTSMSYTVDYQRSRYHTYEENKVVYVQSGSSFDTVVDFGAKIGDRWRVLGWNDCPYQHFWKVYEIDSVTVNGQSLKVIRTSFDALDWGGDTNTFMYEFVEGIFHFYGGNFMPYICIDPNLIIEEPSRTFNCYRDDELGVYPASGGPCQKRVDLSEHSENAVKVYSEGRKLIVEARGEDLRIEVFDVTGRILLDERTNSSNREFYVPGADADLLIVTLSGNGHRIKTAKVLVGDH